MLLVKSIILIILPLTAYTNQESTDNCTQTNIFLQYSKCAITYEKCGEQQHFKVTSCKQQNQCTSNNLRSCTQYTYTYLQNNGVCQNTCCYTQSPQQDRSTEGSFSKESLQQCINQDMIQQNIIIGLVIGLAVGATILAILSFIVYSVFFKKAKGAESKQEKKQYQIFQQPSHQAFWESFDNKINQKYQTCQQNQQQDKQKECSICTENNTEAITSCGHNFHLKCLIDWIKRRKVCPLCLNSNFNPLKIQCLTCRSKFCSIKIGKGSNFDKLLQKGYMQCGCEKSIKKSQNPESINDL